MLTQQRLPPLPSPSKRAECLIKIQFLFLKNAIFTLHILRTSSENTSHYFTIWRTHCFAILPKLYLCIFEVKLSPVFIKIIHPSYLPFTFYFCLLSPQTFLSSGTTVRSWWAMGAVGSLAGQSVTSQAVQLLITGWRTRWLTAAPAAQFASPLLSDATTAGTAGSSSVRSKKITAVTLPIQLWLALFYSILCLCLCLNREISVACHIFLCSSQNFSNIWMKIQL